jgi:polysaccharide pyruvyl transferase WcaK-like protein
MNVSIVNCYHDSNKGSCAILWGLIRRLQSTGLVNSISLVSMFQKTHPLYDSSFRHVKSGFPEVSTTYAPLPSSKDVVKTKDEKIRGTRSSYKRLLSIVNAMIKLKFLTRKEGLLDQPLRTIITSDLVLDRGGPFFAANDRFFNLTLYKNAYPLLIAKKFGVPYALAPGTFGPFASKWAKRFVQRLVDDAVFVMARDLVSKDELATCSISPDRIAFSLDSAFWVEGYLSSRMKHIMNLHDLKPGQFLTVTTRSWYARPLQRYHEELAATIDSLVPSHFQKVALITNMVDPEDQLADDRQATLHLYGLIKKKEFVTVLDDDFAPNELVGLYGQARLTLGTRLHSVIMALAAGSPAVAVSYIGHKTTGIMQTVGLNEYVLELEEFSREAAIPRIMSALSMSDQIMPKIERFRQEGDLIFRSALQRSLRPARS